MAKIINTNRRLIGGARLLSQDYLVATVQGRAIEGLMTASTVTTAGVVTYTAAQLLGGLILRNPNGAGRSDVLPTASSLAEFLVKPKAGTSFEFTVRNTATAAETITMTVGTGATISGTATIAQNNTKRFLVVLTNTTNSPAYTVYSLGTVVH